MAKVISSPKLMRIVFGQSSGLHISCNKASKKPPKPLPAGNFNKSGTTASNSVGGLVSNQLTNKEKNEVYGTLPV